MKAKNKNTKSKIKSLKNKKMKIKTKLTNANNAKTKKTETKLLKVNSKKPEKEIIKEAASVLKKGGIVAFPTETVYGLGANALNEKAVKKIFRAKGRPSNDPLIVHISNAGHVKEVAKEINANAKKLMKKFWPGPLTIVLKKKSKVPKITTAGLNTVAIRIPSNKVALALIKEAGIPIAAPSANLFGFPSPTKAEHVLHDLKGKIDSVIDGGKTKIGLESTVLDLSGNKAVLLRPGKISAEEIEKVIGEIEIHETIEKKKKKVKSLAPGMMYKHYSPKAKVILVEGRKGRARKKAVHIFLQEKLKHGKSAIISAEKPEAMAKTLFAKLREADLKGMKVVVVEGISEEGLGVAVMNRVRRAADRIVKV